MVKTMLAMMAPDHPAHMAVTNVAITLQQTALATVLLCDSVNIASCHKKAPFGAKCYYFVKTPSCLYPRYVGCTRSDDNSGIVTKVSP